MVRKVFGRAALVKKKGSPVESAWGVQFVPFNDDGKTLDWDGAVRTSWAELDVLRKTGMYQDVYSKTTDEPEVPASIKPTVRSK